LSGGYSDATAAAAAASFARARNAAEPDSVNHPAHYNIGGLEVIDAIEAWDLDFSLGNAVKYIARAGKKDPARTIEDLEKAQWYLRRRIEQERKR